MLSVVSAPLGAIVWVGGHLMVLLGILPGALQSRDPAPVRGFEVVYERIGIPALLVRIVTGFWLATLWLAPSQWLSDASVAHLVQTKLVLLAMTALLGVHARLALIPWLDGQRLPQLGLYRARGFPRRRHGIRRA
ncbi:copper transporter [Stutzerimonas urumqiensis]